MLSLFKKTNKPLIIGICGRSCSGKSRVVRKLSESYKDVLHINQDKFFKVHHKNFEDPDCLRNDRLIYSLKKLKKGKSTHIPSHRWTEVFDKEVKPHKVIIVEGYLLFENKELADLFDKKIFVDVSDVNILYRRTKRDGTSQHIDYTMNNVILESWKYNDIQKKRADIIIDGNKSKEEVLEEVKKLLKKELKVELK